jgi:hypothetical protein
MGNRRTLLLISRYRCGFGRTAKTSPKTVKTVKTVKTMVVQVHLPDVLFPAK